MCVDINYQIIIVSTFDIENLIKKKKKKFWKTIFTQTSIVHLLLWHCNKRVAHPLSYECEYKIGHC